MLPRTLSLYLRRRHGAAGARTTACFLGRLGLAAIAACGSILSFSGVASAAAESAPALRLVRDYPLPGKATRWDYMSLDASRSLLFIAHLGDSAVVAVDTKTKAVLATIGNIGRVHGVVAIPELGRAYATATRTNEVVAIDAQSLKTVARTPTGAYPDGLAYAPNARKVYVSDEEGGTETVVDVGANRRVATIPLGGSVGNTQYDPVSGHIFVNVQGTAELVEIDPGTDKVIERIPVPGADGNHGLLIEPTLRLAFIACEGNDRLLVMDLRTKKVVAGFRVDGQPDVLAYDAGLGWLYVASESGLIHRFKVSGQGVSRAGDAKIGANAHTLAVDPATHEVYLPLKPAGKAPVLRVMRPAS
ncbi:MAG: YncE family protein [Burkholderiaceae bacterium]